MQLRLTQCRAIDSDGTASWRNIFRQSGFCQFQRMSDCGPFYRSHYDMTVSDWIRPSSAAFGTVEQPCWEFPWQVRPRRIRPPDGHISKAWSCRSQIRTESSLKLEGSSGPAPSGAIVTAATALSRSRVRTHGFFRREQVNRNVVEASQDARH